MPVVTVQGEQYFSEASSEPLSNTALYRYKFRRKPFIFTSTYQNTIDSSNMILCAVNPNQMGIQWNPRGGFQKTMGGAVKYDTVARALKDAYISDFRAEDSRVLDPAIWGNCVVRFTFQSGNVLPIYIREGEVNSG